LEKLDRDQYAYELVQLRWTRGDNGPPDEAVMPAVRDWNAKYEYPKHHHCNPRARRFTRLKTATRDQLPVLRGDMTRIGGWRRLVCA